MTTGRARSLAFYLPQFHPIPENDEWWGAGFTEWRNVARGAPRFPGHQQPHLPGELGFYDLRLPEVRAAQAELARAPRHRRVLLLPLLVRRPAAARAAVRRGARVGEPDFPFCLCWANENWTRALGRLATRRARRAALLRRRRPRAHPPAGSVPSPTRATCGSTASRCSSSTARRACPTRGAPPTSGGRRPQRLGVGELYLCRVESFPNERGDPRRLGFDAAVEFQPNWRQIRHPRCAAESARIAHRLGVTRFDPAYTTYDYRTLVAGALTRPTPPYTRYPCVTPRWDNTAASCRRARDRHTARRPSSTATGCVAHARPRRPGSCSSSTRGTSGARAPTWSRATLGGAPTSKPTAMLCARPRMPRHEDRARARPAGRRCIAVPARDHVPIGH